MIDIVHEITAVHRGVAKRRVGDAEDIGVQLRRGYDAAIGDVWDAVTDPDRIKRWFAPVSGDLQVGGTFQVEGNAGGEILRCEPPRLLKITWGGPASVVELRLSAVGDNATALELEHAVPLEMAGSGAGALYVGPGWDISLVSLALFLNGETVEDVAAWESSPPIHNFSGESIKAWTATVEASGTASIAETAAAAEAARAQFTPGR